MNTILVWMLIVHTTPGNPGATVYVIDNIATQAECERVQKVVLDGVQLTTRTRCVQVAKVKGQQ